MADKAKEDRARYFVSQMDGVGIISFMGVLDEELPTVIQAIKDQLIYGSFYGIIMDFRMVRQVNSGAHKPLQEFKDYLLERNRYLQMSGLNEALKEQFSKEGLVFDYEIVKRVKDGIVKIVKLQEPIEE
jgi:hypothetical protein